MRVAEILGSLSLSTDLADGFSLEKCLRTAVIATRLARLASGDPKVHRSVFWSSLLRFTGCTGFAHEEGRYYSAGDDRSLRATLAYVDFSRPRDFLGRALAYIAPEAPLIDRAKAVGRLLSTPSAPRQHALAQCEAGQAFARTVGMPDVGAVLRLRGERWDGRGPLKLAQEEALPFAARVSDVADVAELFGYTHGPAEAAAELGRRRGGELDPSLVDLFLSHAGELWPGIFEGSVWELFLEAEPKPWRTAETDADRVQYFSAFAALADLSSVYTLGHSSAVAALAGRAAEIMGLAPAEVTLAQLAGLSHDLGRVAVAIGIWEKRGSLSPYERERVRTHSQQTETILRLAPALGDLAEVAAAAHERGSGRGYHRRLSSQSVPLVARILAASDVCVALGSERPHRPRLPRAELEHELRSLERSAELDPRATRAVLEAAELGVRRAPRRDCGLTEREVEVVRLVAVGRTNSEIGALLGMSPRTAQKHVMNVYQKLGLESRAGVALFAVEHGLLEGPH